MNCPLCESPLVETRGADGYDRVRNYRCPQCSGVEAAARRAAFDTIPDPLVVYRSHTTPEQLRELIERTPCDGRIATTVLSALWVHHCEAMVALIRNRADAASLVRLAELRSEAAELIRTILKTGEQP